MATNTDTTPAAAGEGAPVALPYGVMLRLEDSLYEVQEAVAILDRLLTYSVLDTGATVPRSLPYARCTRHFPKARS